jgi:hypothetical protein
MEWIIYKHPGPCKRIRLTSSKTHITISENNKDFKSLVDLRRGKPIIFQLEGVTDFAVPNPGVRTQPFVLGRRGGNEESHITKWNMDGEKISKYSVPHNVDRIEIMPGGICLFTRNHQEICYTDNFKEIGHRFVSDDCVISNDYSKCVKTTYRQSPRLTLNSTKKWMLSEGVCITEVDIPRWHGMLLPCWSSCSRYVCLYEINDDVTIYDTENKLAIAAVCRVKHVSMLLPMLSDTEYTQQAPPLFYATSSDGRTTEIYNPINSKLLWTVGSRSARNLHWVTHNVWIEFREEDNAIVAHACRQWTKRWWTDVGRLPSAKVLAMARCLSGDLMNDVMAVVMCLV